MTDNRSNIPTQLVVFSDDWGRHPSSCQHLVRHLLPRHPTTWVNTIGTRAPGLSLEDARKVAVKLRQWLGAARQEPGAPLPPNLSVVTPLMYPGFGRPWQRRLNRALITRKLHAALRRRRPGTPAERRVAVTTVPVTADLVGALDVDRWVYYCVDDFSQWPGLDGRTMARLDRDLIERVDCVVCVSRTLQERVASLGRPSTLLTHGIELEHWRTPAAPDLPAWWGHLHPPVSLFWGLVDRRLDTAWCVALAHQGGTLVLVGPQQAPDRTLTRTANIVMPGPVRHDQLPSLAAAAGVLVMPYADLPVTRAMQPLKFKEYLAAGRPVVARRLPALADWDDAADLVESAEAFARRVADRHAGGVTVSQAAARARLRDETWAHKARQLEALIVA